MLEIGDTFPKISSAAFFEIEFIDFIEFREVQAIRRGRI